MVGPEDVPLQSKNNGKVPRTHGFWPIDITYKPEALPAPHQMVSKIKKGYFWKADDG